MADTQGLDLDLLDNLWKKLDEVYQKLIEIDGLFDKLGSKSVKFAFDGNIRKLTTELEKLDLALGRISDRNSSQGLSAVFETIDKVNTINVSRRKLNILTDFADIMTKFRDAIGGGGFARTVTQIIAIKAIFIPLFSIFEQIASIGNGLTIGKLKEINALLQTFKETVSSLAAIVFSMTHVPWQLASPLFLVANFVIVQLVKLLKEIIQVSATSSVGKLEQTSVILIDLVRFLENIKDFLDKSATISNFGEYTRVFSQLLTFFFLFKPVINSLTGILTALSGFTPAGLKNVTETINALGTFYGAIALMTEKAGGIVVDLGIIKTWVAVNFVIAPLIGPIFDILGLLVRLNQRELASVARIFDGIGQMYVSIAQMVQLINSYKLGILQALNLAIATWIALRPFIGVIKTVIEAAKGVSGSQLEGIGQFFRGIGIAFTGLASLTRQVDKQGIIKSFINNLILNFIVLPPLINIIKKVSKATAGLSENQLRGIGEVFSGLAAVLRPLAQFSRDVRRVASFSDLVQTFLTTRVIFGAFGKLIESVVKASKNIKAGTDLDSFSKVLGNLGKIVTEFGILAHSRKLDKSILNSFADFFEIIPKVFNKIKFDEKAGKGLESFLGILTKLIEGGDITKEQVEAIKGLAQALVELSKANLNDLGDLDQIGMLFKHLAEGMKDLDSAKLSNLADIARNIKDLKKYTDDLRQSREQNNKQLDVERVNQAATIIIYNKLKDGLKALASHFLDIGKIAVWAYQNLSPKGLLLNGIKYLGEFGDKIREVGEQLRDAGEQMRDFGTNIIDTFGIQNIFQSQAFESAVDFDKIGKQLQIFGGLNDEARAQAEAFAFEIGKKYPLSANDALGATLDLIKAGQDLSSVEFILPAAADLSALSDEGNLEAITGTLIAAEGIFKKFDDDTEGTFANISRVSDIIAAAADVSTASVESLSAGLANAGPAADAFGLTLEETSAILAIFNDAGIQAAEGGTALRSLLNALDRPGTQVALRSLGVSLFDQGGSRRPINEIINDIGGALDGLPDSERARVLQRLADTFGRQGLNILLAQGADGIQDVIDEMNGVAPASGRAADSLDNLAGDMIQLQGSTETLIVAALQPLLEDFFRPLVKVARFVVDGILSLDRSVLRFVSTAIVLTSTLATLFGGVVAFLGILIQVGGTVLTVVGFLLNFVNVITILVGGTAAIAAGFAVLSIALVTIVPIIAAVTATFISLVEIFRNDLGGARTALEQFVGKFASYGTAIKNLVEGFGSLFHIISFGAQQVGGVSNPLLPIAQGIRNFFDALTGGFGSVDEIFAKVNSLGNLFKGLGTLFDLGQQLGSLNSQIEEYTNLGISGVTSGLSYQRDQIKEQMTGIIRDLLGDSIFLRKIFLDFGEGDVTQGIYNLISQLAALGGSFRTYVIVPIQQFFRDVGRGEPFTDALTKLFDSLDSGIGFFIGQVISLFGRIFGFDQEVLTAVSGEAEKGLGSFMQYIIQQALNFLKDQVIAHRGFLREAFVQLFQFFFSPLKAVKFFANLFGIKPLQDFIGAFENLVSGLVGGLFDTFVNLLEGQDLGTALLNAFGEGAAPVVNLINVIGTAFQHAFTIISNIFNAFTRQFAGETVNVGSLFEAIVNSIANTISLIDRFILTPLASGNIIGALTNFGNALIGVFFNLFTTIKGVMDSIDLGAIFSGVGQTILDAILTGISLAFSTITDLTGIDFSVLEGLISEKLQTTFDTLTAIFAGNDERASIFENIVTVVNNIATAFSNLFTTFSTEADSIDTESLTTVQEFLGFIAGLTLDVLLLPLRALDTFFASLATLDQEQLVQVAAASVTLFGAFALITNAATILTALTGMGAFLGSLSLGSVSLVGILAGGFSALGTAISAFAGTLVGKFAGFAAILLILNSIVNNLDEFMQVVDAIGQGNIGEALIQAIDALVAFFANIAFTLFDLLGIGDLIGQTEEEFMSMIRGVGSLFIDVLRLGFQELLDRLAIGVQQAFSVAVVGALEALRGVSIFGQQLISDEQIQGITDGLVGGFNKAVGAIDAEQIDFGNFFGSGADDATLERLARLNARKYIDAISTQIADSENPLQTLFTDESLQQAITLGIDAGIGDQIIADLIGQIGQGETIQFLQTTIVPQLDAEGFGDFAGLLQNLVDQGVISQDVALSILTDVTLVTDDEDVREKAQSEVNRIQGEIDASTSEQEPVDIPVTTEPDMEVQGTAEAATEARDQIQQELDTLASETDTTPVELGAGVNLDVTEQTSPEELDNFATSLTNLRSQVGLLATELAAFPETTLPGYTALQGLKQVITDIGLKAVFAVLQMTLMNTTLLIFGAVASAQFNRAKTAATNFFDYLIHSLEISRQGLIIVNSTAQELAETLQSALQTISDIGGAIDEAQANAASTDGGGGDNTGNTGGNAIGGVVQGNQRSQVVERNQPEAFFDGNKMYLLTGSRGGKIEPLSNLLPNLGLAGAQRANAALPAAQAAQGGVVNNASSVTIQQGDIVIQVSGSDADALSIANRTATAVRSANQESAESVNEELRKNFR